MPIGDRQKSTSTLPSTRPSAPTPDRLMFSSGQLERDRWLSRLLVNAMCSGVPVSILGEPTRAGECADG